MTVVWSLVNVTLVEEDACLTRFVVVVVPAVELAAAGVLSSSVVSVVELEDPLPPDPLMPPAVASSTQMAVMVRSPDDPEGITIVSTGMLVPRDSHIQPTKVKPSLVGFVRVMEASLSV